MDNFNHLHVINNEGANHLANPSVAVLNTDYEPNFNRLVERLQTSLDIEVILQTFAEEAAKVVDVKGVQFQSDNKSFTSKDFKASLINHCEDIVVADEFLGLLSFNLTTPVTEATQRIIASLTTKLSYPLKHALAFEQLRKQALNDQLTGLGNRSFFEEKFAKSMENALATGNDLTLVLIDLDNFKQVNDNWGHIEGDKILKEFGYILNDSIRKTDLAFRFGGDEFAIILEGANEMAARRIGNVLKKNVNTSKELSAKGVSASIGFAKYDFKLTDKQFFSLADSALYKAKHAGRNCLRMA